MERLGEFDWRGSFFGAVAACVATVVVGIAAGLSDPARSATAQPVKSVQVDRQWERTQTGYGPLSTPKPVVVPTLHPAIIAAEILLLSLLALAAFPSRAPSITAPAKQRPPFDRAESAAGPTWKRPAKSAKMTTGSSGIPRSDR